MISEKGLLVVTDRLGSVRGDSTATNFSYFPWGEERGTTAHTCRTLFAGYYRDAVGQDYVMARYYNATTGAFWSQDPGSIKTADPTNPLSWNRYAYVIGDPVNLGDPTGRIACDPEEDEGCAAAPIVGCDDDSCSCADDTACDDGAAVGAMTTPPMMVAMTPATRVPVPNRQKALGWASQPGAMLRAVFWREVRRVSSH